MSDSRTWDYGCILCSYRLPGLTLAELTQVNETHMTVRHPGGYDAAARQGALDSERGGTDRQARDDLERLGVASSVRRLTPASAGHAVRIIVGDGSATGVLHLEPQQALDLADQLRADALEAIYADRAVRRG